MKPADGHWCCVCRMQRAVEGKRCQTCARYRRRTGRERSDRYPDVEQRQASLNERHAMGR